MGKIIIKDFIDYCVDEVGNVYSYKNKYERKLKPQKDRWGYLTVCLRKKQKTFNKKIHRLVAEAFIPNKHKKMTVNHKNGIKTDNKVENLEWATMSEQNKHKYNVLGNKGFWYKKSGFDNHSSKSVIMLKDGEVYKIFGSIAEATRETGIKTIRDALKGKIKFAGGYKWEYNLYKNKGVI